MKKSVLSSLILSMAMGWGLGTAMPAQAEVLMQWERKPLAVDLNMDSERIIVVDKNVAVGLPSSLQGKLRVQSSGGAVYLRAAAPFNSTRLQLRDLDTGSLILLDVRAHARKGKLEDVRIVSNENVSSSKNSISQVLKDDASPSTSSPNIAEQSIQSALPAPAALVRYAAQSLYAPLRTVEPLPGVRRVSMGIKSIPNLLPNLSVTTTPLESWGLDDYIVTAIRIKNREPHRVELDPRYLQGNFYAAAFQHNWLGESGTLEDTTVVYLVTQGPIKEALYANVVSSVKKTGKKKK